MSRLRTASLVALVTTWSMHVSGAQLPPRLPPLTPAPPPPEKPLPTLGQVDASRCDRPTADTTRRFDSSFTQHKPLKDCGLGLGFGLEGGSSEMTLTGGSSGNNPTQEGIVLGAYLYKQLLGALSFQPELEYTHRGALVLANGATTRLHFDDLELPLLLRVSNEEGAKGTPPAGQTFGLFAELGPEIDLNLSCKSSALYDGLATTSSCGAGTPEGISRTVYGVIGGVGADFVAFGQLFTTAARYDFGGESLSSGLDERTRGLTLLFGIRW